ncbi:aspartate-semialdehyde dehydrogenase [Acidithiobacillus sp. CV18-2]|uniref:Aspartate-semialdehyde dehydrogenase n=1 Tax=Igneacidithiobacillus copahuensis TaxID=2724909 RepID=A0AAE3CKT3_9PROT|nr:aspartate-semialdehyde dehydrogenase [Igneacidithiobacillus copahuensis]MBU2755623.1 aspartate-semialdehyde dehydrogenase [Acidithiobacillus sp. CV18-3]MBU2758031.1 aspartate-semialdehyde dehydrogenase [Acidithiobacillus sp. BN09-2]MBU2777385.1 aspartate-semialdehyde dehydrogenase [Acidithiobacillus sp. CV18-2]MBU2796887.1 aspartate-semialdehyde dehydrogenase [Acidithiobacillus sp. VAN18-2]MBU2799382.1 aspartate-semialdehyde dehydrogenase [Acidithiobacillus sp. VAN18-4]UTV79920.1 aspartate
MKKNAYKVAILGATGAVGEVMREILAERNFPVSELFLLASERSAGDTLDFAGKAVRVRDAATFDWTGVDIGLFSAGAAASEIYAPKAAAAGAVVIDNTSRYRYEEDIPLVVPEVNPQRIADYQTRNIIANPNCSTIQMLLALKPIADSVGLERVVVSTYQAVSGAGSRAIQELGRQTLGIFKQEEVAPAVFPKQIAFNCLPQIDVFQDNGYTKEEMKMLWESRKILEIPDLPLSATCVRVPVFYGHSEAVNVVTRKKLSAEEMRALLCNAPGVQIWDERETGGWPTALDSAGKDATWVGRIREDCSHERGLNFWVVADNIRKGAALNSVQIAEILIRDYL